MLILKILILGQPVTGQYAYSYTKYCWIMVGENPQTGSNEYSLFIREKFLEY